MFRKMSKAEAQEIAQWRYPEPYTFYNPDDASKEEYVAWLLIPRYHYHSIYEDGKLTGLCCFGEDAQIAGGDYSQRDLWDIGLGMHPALTGQGRGSDFLAAIMAFAEREYDAKQFRATIAAFNQRSQRLFARAGFQRVQRFASLFDRAMEFVVMVKSP
jgi:RimJ/RimL family protein N-acetyltransferase